MNDTVRLSQAPPDRTSMNYAALRESGMELIRQLAKVTWTDHNVHDPGITLLEAFSYAMTELGFRLQLDVRDLLRSGEHYAIPDLVPVHRVLPSAPVTTEDLHKILLDHHLVNEAWIAFQTNPEVPFYENVGMDPPFTYTPGTSQVQLQGLYEVMLNFEERDWNSNSYSLEVNVPNGIGDERYLLDIALPHWDEVEATPFRAGATINTVTMVNSGTGVWRALSEPQSYFGTLQVNYTDATETTSIDLWVLLRITGEQPASVIPNILAVAKTKLETIGAGSLIAKFTERVRTAYRGVLQLQRYTESWRNLCEYPVRLKVARRQEIALRARIEVTGSTDLEQLLAEIFFAIDLALSPSMQFSSLAEMRNQGKTAEALYDGPLLRHGFLKKNETDSLVHTDRIYTSDILRIIMRLRGSDGTDVIAQENPTGRDIVAVTDLALSNFINNRPITTDAQNCLNLVEIERYRPHLSVLKSRITFVRNDVEVSYKLSRVEALFIEMQRQYKQSTEAQAFSPIWPVQHGEEFPIADYFAFQNDLPRIYGVGEAGVPESAGQAGKARALQTQGYLLLFEQFLADLTAQLGNINRFFSSNPEEQATYFTHALLELPGMEKLLRRFPSDGDWSSYVTDGNNSYRIALQTVVESREQFLDRRNRMLDHLLARQGEATVSWGQELHRWAQQNLEAAFEEVNASPTLKQRETRRQAVNARLIRDKAKFLAAVPDLNMGKLQAFGNPLRQHPEWLQVESTSSGFRWVLVLNGEPQLRSVSELPTTAAAVINAEEAVLLAAQINFYQVVNAEAGRFRYSLKDGTDAGAQMVGESLNTWTTEDAVGDALTVTAAAFARMPLETSMTPMEQRIAYLTGIPSQVRRRLSVPINAFFEIYDEVDSDGILEKRWRLWELPGYTGDELLSSVDRFTGTEEEPTEARAIEQAQASIQRVLRYGLDEWNYHISPEGTDTYKFELRHPNGDRLGLRNPPMPSEAEAQAAINETIEHLYSLYSAEGFHTVEHLLLRPRQTGDRFLSLPVNESERERNPYRQRLSLVFPSGYGRDFSLAPGESERREVPPHRFRDPEFRHHVERMVEQACPAHLWPKIYWCDRHLPLTPASPTTFETLPSCFEHFEEVYFNWLETQLIPGIKAKAVNAARKALIISLNEVSQQ